MEVSGKRVLEIAKYKISSPTTVWFGSLYFFGLFSMIMNNIFRLGFSWNAIANAPSYYAGLFLNYGLNSEGTYTSPYESGILAWLMAPFIAIWMGLVLYYLRDAGFAYNGNTRFMDPFLPAGNPFYAFFSTDVYGAGDLIFGIKGNMFYISIVWMPIIFASILTLIYSKWTKRESWIVTRVFFNFVIAAWIAVNLAKITNPTVSLNLGGFFKSVFVDRRNNYFVVYDGQYNPAMLTFVFALFQFVSIVVAAAIDGLISLSYLIRRKYEEYQERQEYLEEAKSKGITKLPWEEDEAEMNASASNK